jgi:hypothetical protein
LSFYRTHAAHRGVLVERARFGLDAGLTLRIGDFDGPHPNRAEALPILREIIAWTENELAGLLGVARAWEGPSNR